MFKFDRTLWRHTPKGVRLTGENKRIFAVVDSGPHPITKRETLRAWKCSSLDSGLLDHPLHGMIEWSDVRIFDTGTLENRPTVYFYPDSLYEIVPASDIPKSGRKFASVTTAEGSFKVPLKNSKIDLSHTLWLVTKSNTYGPSGFTEGTVLAVTEPNELGSWWAWECSPIKGTNKYDHPMLGAVIITNPQIFKSEFHGTGPNKQLRFTKSSHLRLF